MSTELEQFRPAAAAARADRSFGEARLTSPEVDLHELARRVWRWRRLVLALSAGAAFAVGIRSCTLADTYRSEALLMPSSKEASGIDGVAGRVFGLARITAIDLGEDDQRTAFALETLKSRSFAIRFVREHGLAPLLLAADSWDRARDQISFDPDLYDARARKWVRPARGGRPSDPTDTEIYQAFKRRVSVSEARHTGFVTVSVDFIDPALAKQWLDSIIVDVNRTVRDREAADARRNIAYLERQIPETALVEVRNVLYELLAEQEKLLMLAQAREEFAFKVIDPPAVADEKLGPQRILSSAFGGLAGLALGAVLALVLPDKTTSPVRPPPDA